MSTIITESGKTLELAGLHGNTVLMQEKYDITFPSALERLRGPGENVAEDIHKIFVDNGVPGEDFGELITAIGIVANTRKRLIDVAPAQSINTDQIEFSRIMADLIMPPEYTPEAGQPEKMRKFIATLAIRGAKVKNCGSMCSSCAFKLDSPANLEPHNVEAAFESLAFGGQFNCHIDTDIDSGHPCKGFLNALQALEPEQPRKIWFVNYAKIDFRCPYCDKHYRDHDDRFLKRCNKNKSGSAEHRCDCGNRFKVLFDMTGCPRTIKLGNK
jgi:hypothetical protein